MDDRTETGDAHRVLPDGAQPCVWMLAGIVSYRLCDRDYDCEHCPLDEGIRGSPATPGTAVRDVPAASPGWGIRDGLTYHPVYGWVSPVGEGRWRWGVDALTARLLDRASTVILPVEGTVVVQGKVACWVLDDGELMPLRAPVSGTVTRTNHAVQRDPGLLTHSPYEAGWLIEVEAGGGPSARLPGLGSAESRRTTAARRMERFHRAAMGYLHLHQEVGPTAPDGGEPLEEWRTMLGPSRYHRLVFSVLR